MSELSTKDRKLLRDALQSGHAFEKFFNSENELIFRISLESCAAAESFLVQKLSELAGKVALSLGPKHLMALLVPLERLSGRSARDEEFLFLEKDGANSFMNSDLPTRIVVCENIRSAFNVGSVYRTSETFAGNEVWLAGYTPDPQKTAMGADLLVTTRRFERTLDALHEAKKLGLKTVALENSPGATPLESFKWPERALLVLGNERFGVDSQTLEACDHVVRISTAGLKNSLNVGIAFGIAASQWRKQDSLQALTADGMSHGIRLSPIGFLRGGFENPQTAPRQGAYTPNSTGSLKKARIELEARFEGRPSNFEQALKDLEGFERAWVIFGFDQSDGWNPQVRPPRGDGSKRGLFATRSPRRPNRIGISCVRIGEIRGRNLEISEHDLLEGTPIFDIKPYVPEADAFPEAEAGWLEHVHAAAYFLEESDAFRERVRWLEAQGEMRLRDFVREQLQFQPFDQTRKRTKIATSQGENHSIAFRTWRIEFRELPGQKLRIETLRSGYTTIEMNELSDAYEDKDLHRQFRKVFHEEA